MQQGESASDILLDATQDFESWPDALRSIAGQFNADHGFAYLVTPRGTHAFASRGSEEVLAKVVAGGWHERNPRMGRGLEHARSGPVGLLTDWRLFTPVEIARDHFEQEFARWYDCMHYAGTFIPFAPESFLVVSFERSHRKGEYWGSELDLVSRNIEQVRRSVAYALKAQAQLATGLVDVLSDAGPAHAWLGADGRLQHGSPAFLALVGRFVGIRSGRVHALDNCDYRLQVLISAAANGERINDTVALHSPSQPGDIAFARALPMRTMNCGLRAYADVLLSIEVQPARETTLETILRDRFALTPAEIRLVLRLDRGMRLRDAADAEKIAYETARTRLKTIFGKLGVIRQAELIRRLGEFSAGY